ncbi:multi-sensor signal transduction histidine kinase [Arcobacter nitrofigilis DSM 7299]|uniref:Multi-sensor signal transduction histidine kinase n=1 Tax=Arcobacter nitrofigilis (strain ATCC 33309 / DSM 7299 / CCUG 15893 / LMG 7604 / NCTC 12251 / CI) TaxID=572480 RepID=D5V6T9_ARCNC|nr:CHASE domain-containing protein [Arcobacter nitrofigilis]ADG94359.1 multi-sensor signal transduction histidine kinase [Arcobacter nitrofigilis DSM 7299]
MIGNKYKLHVSSIIIIGLFLSISISYLINNIEEKNIQSRFQNIVDDKMKSFYREILINLETLYTLSILYNNDQIPSREEFSIEAKKIIKRHSAIHALEWIPIVSNEKRKLFEKNFFFTEESKNNNMVKVGKKDEYFPVYYVEPFKNNEKALGFDLSSDENRYKTIKKALETKSPQVTQAIELVQKKNKKGFLAFLPIFDENQNIKSFVLGVFVIEDIFKKSILEEDKTSNEINFKIFDTTNNINEEIYSHNSLNKIYKHLKYKKDLPVIWSRQWTFEAIPSLKYINERRSFVTELSLFIGILLTIIVSYRINKFYNLKYESIQELKNKDEILYIQSRYATIGETLSNIEHQWRSPLSKVSSNIISLQSEIEFKGMPSQEKLQSSLNNMQNTLVYMSNLVDEFKNFHIQDKIKTNFLFDDTLDIALKLLEHDFTKLELRVKRDNKKNQVRIYGYQNEFSQVLINILSNCRDAFIERRVNKPLVEIFTYEKDNKKFITIRDNAGGIDEKHIENIFEQFFTTKQSSGIGLHLCKMIITEHMNGKISVKNGTFYINKEKCTGAIFTIELPV